MKKTAVILSLAMLVLTQTQTKAQEPQGQPPPELTQGQDVKLNTLIPEDERKILEERKKQEYYDLLLRNESIKTQTELSKKQNTILKKRLDRTQKIEDIRDKELKDVYKMYKYKVPVMGVVGNMAITDGLVLMEGSYVGANPITKINIKSISAGNQPIQIHNVSINDLREKALESGSVDIFTDISQGANAAIPPLPAPPPQGVGTGMGAGTGIQPPVR